LNTKGELFPIGTGGVIASHTFFKGGDDLRAIAEGGDADGEDGEGRGGKSAATRNQFNYNERAAQTLNHALRVRSTSSPMKSDITG
jgi:hypothetical protein